MIKNTAIEMKKPLPGLQETGRGCEAVSELKDLQTLPQLKCKGEKTGEL